ncbi:hypothetical protein D9758_003852 [Tetrapyrgos nigripes]|uniref:Uncharacterized protein n=1 Tax=Tetrapyrgos nigripes TaxID=182062 RepID=A0A8H5GLH2_9AGAR|nr:hypothetical protein D9758_003852 [Tetrapyrgos nigripes]
MRTSLLTSQSLKHCGHDSLGLVGPSIPILLLARTLSTGDMSRPDHTFDDRNIPVSPKIAKGKEKEKEKENEKEQDVAKKKHLKQKIPKKFSRLFLRAKISSIAEEEEVDVVTPYNPSNDLPSTPLSSSANANSESTTTSMTGKSQPYSPVVPFPNTDPLQDEGAIDSHDEASLDSVDWDAYSEITLIHATRLRNLDSDDRGLCMFSPDQTQTPQTGTLRDKSATTADQICSSPIATVAVVSSSSSSSCELESNDCNRQKAAEVPMNTMAKRHGMHDVLELDHDESVSGYDERSHDEDQVHGQEARGNKMTWKYLAKNLNSKYIALKLDITDAKHHDAAVRKSRTRSPNSLIRKPMRSPVSAGSPMLSADDLGKVNAFYAPRPTHYAPPLPPKDHVYTPVLDISRLNILHDDLDRSNTSIPISPISPLTPMTPIFSSSYDEPFASPVDDVHDMPITPNGPIFFTLECSDSSQWDEVELVMLDRSPLDEERVGGWCGTGHTGRT